MTACSCAPCARTFSGLVSFDRHQDVDYNRRPVVICQDPAGIGMALDQHGRWHTPASEADRARLSALKARRGA